jgi:hypothetical protein
MRRALLAALVLLPGCAPPPPAPPAPPPPQASAPPPPPPVTRYDGRYAGPIRLARGARCADGQGGQRVMTVDNGRVSLAMAQGSTPLRGTVQADGALRAVDPIDRGSVIAGQIVNNRFVGTWQNGRCGYEMTLRRQ